MIARSLSRLSPYGRELPAEFWFLWLGTVINRLGGFAVPFLMLYLTAKRQMDPATAALFVSVLGAGSFVAQLVGGEVADRFGRRPVLLFSLFAAPVAMLSLGVVREPWLIAVAMFALGFLTDLFRPAMSAAVVDLVPADRRTRAFGYITGRSTWAQRRHPSSRGSWPTSTTSCCSSVTPSRQPSSG